VTVCSATPGSFTPSERLPRLCGRRSHGEPRWTAAPRQPGATMTTREGNLEAPTRHPIDWKNPEFYDEDKCLQEMERIFDICHGCRRCVSLCQSFPTLFDLVDESRTARSTAWPSRLLEGGRPVLPVRPLLHDQVPLRAAAPVERGLPAHDAAGQGDQVQEGRGGQGRAVPGLDRRARPVRRHPHRRAGGQCGEQDQADAQGARQGAGRAPRRLVARSGEQPLSLERQEQGAATKDVQNGERTPGKVAIFSTCYVNYNEPGIGTI
jgi:glycerol-3-phosphate dehydrogenase subunit C